MGNRIAMGGGLDRFTPALRRPTGAIPRFNPVEQPNPGLITQMVQGVPPPNRATRRIPQKPNLQQAQRVNPPEVPTRKFY